MIQKLKHNQTYWMNPTFVASDVIGNLSRSLARAVFNF